MTNRDQGRGQTVRSALRRNVPIIDWLSQYDRAWLRTDILAGIIAWGTTVPTAMGFAQIAGLPIQAGLYAALVALLAYAVFGSSPQLKVETSASMAIISAAIVAPLALGDTSYYVTLSAALALVVGLLLIAAIVYWVMYQRSWSDGSEAPSGPLRQAWTRLGFGPALGLATIPHNPVH